MDWEYLGLRQHHCLMFKHPILPRSSISHSCPSTPTSMMASSTSSSSSAHPPAVRVLLQSSLIPTKQKRSANSSVESVASSSPLTSAARTIDAQDLWSAEWPSLIHVPSSFMQEWTSAFSEALLRLSRFPTLENWTYLFCSTKLLLAAPAHGGKQRLHTTERLLRKRFSKWHSGELASLFEDVRNSWTKKSSNKRNSPVLPADLLTQSLPP